MIPKFDTPLEIAALLVKGRAVLRYTKDDEAWYFNAAIAPVRTDPSVKASFSVGVHLLTEDGDDNGCIGEWTIEFYQFESQGHSPAARHLIFNDGAAAVAAIPFYFHRMAGLETPITVEAALIELGFVDVTVRTML
jgi:hypothetical protein